MFVSALAWIYVAHVVLDIVFADVAILIMAKKSININQFPQEMYDHSLHCLVMSTHISPLLERLRAFAVRACDVAAMCISARRIET